MAIFDYLTNTVKEYVDRAVERLDAKDKFGDKSDRSVLEKLLEVDRKLAIIVALDTVLAGVDTVSNRNTENFKFLYLII